MVYRNIAILIIAKLSLIKTIIDGAVKVQFASFWSNEIGGAKIRGPYADNCIQRHPRRLFLPFIIVSFPLTKLVNGKPNLIKRSLKRNQEEA